ncbi:MAG: transcription termination factor Rho [Lachnospira sp.]|nr:transcription termination factor Rho [Lachnospira sp.]
MKEKLEELSLVSLKQIAKDLGIKNVSTLKKGALVDILTETAQSDSRVEDLVSNYDGVKKTRKSKTVVTESETKIEGEDISTSTEDYDGDAVTDLLKNETQQQRYERYERYITPAQEAESKPVAKEEKHITRYVAKDAQRSPRKSYYKSPQYDNQRQDNYSRYDNQRQDNTTRYDNYSRYDNQRQDNTSRYDNQRQDNTSRYDNQRQDNAQRYENHNKAVVNTDIKLEADETLANGILEVLNDGYGFVRCENFLPGDDDVYVSPTQIRKFNLKTGDIVVGPCKLKSTTDKFKALQYLISVNGLDPSVAQERVAFEKLTPIFPNERIHLEQGSSSLAMRMVDLISPIGKGQRGMIVSQPKSGKTTLLKQIAKAVVRNNPEMHLIILLIDERPEEVTDMKESIAGDNVEVIYSTFDEQPDNHRRVSEMVIERAKRLVEQKQDVIILLDSITRLARAYNLTVQASGRTLSGGLDPAALHMPKKFFGAARNMREGGSLTILATALVDTGSKMDDVVFEEFKGTGNMELVLDRKLSERRIFPAIDVIKSSTRREDLLLDNDELEAVNIMRKGLNGSRAEESAERVIDLFTKTRNNADFINRVIKERYV